MGIMFKRIKEYNGYEEYEEHVVLVEGVRVMSTSEGIEPEGTLFCRDLHSPFECEKLLRQVEEAARNGEEINITYRNVLTDS